MSLFGFDLHFHFLSWNLFFYQFFCALFCIIFSETCCLQISFRTSLATDWNHCGLLTEHKFCWKLLRIITIDRCYCNRFINLGRPLFSLNHSGASAATVFTIPTTFSIVHARCYTRAERATQSATKVRSSLLDALSVPSTHYIPQIAFIFSLICRGCTIDLVTIKDLIFFSASATSNNPPFFLVVIRYLRNGTRYLHNDFCIPRAPQNMPHKIYHCNLFPDFDAV